jgi:hypothetical protein
MQEITPSIWKRNPFAEKSKRRIQKPAGEDQAGRTTDRAFPRQSFKSENGTIKDESPG